MNAKRYYFNIYAIDINSGRNGWWPLLYLTKAEAKAQKDGLEAAGYTTVIAYRLSPQELRDYLAEKV